MNINVSIKNNTLTLDAPEWVKWDLYAGVPSNLNYNKAIDPANAIPATDLTPGLYHVTAYAEGYNSVCQVINYTGAPLQQTLPTTWMDSPVSRMRSSMPLWRIKTP